MIMKGRISCWLRGTVGGGLRLALTGLRNLFFVRECAVCGGELEPDTVMPGWPIGSAMTTHVMPGLTGHLLCKHCLNDLPLTRFCLYSENAAMESLSGCRVYNAASLFFYRHESPYCEIVRQFKYGRRESLGLWAARMLGGYLASGGLYDDVQAVVPVPLHPLKQWKRGFNQAEIIARGVADGLGDIAVVPHLLRRRRYTSTQTRRSASSRRSNVSGAFAVNMRELEKLRAAGVTHILIVDDVLTTGATLSECIRLLHDHFTVSAATLGFVE